MPDRKSLCVQLKKRNPSSAIVGPHKNCSIALYRASEYCSKIHAVLSFGLPARRAPECTASFHGGQLGRRLAVKLRSVHEISLRT